MDTFLQGIRIRAIKDMQSDIWKIMPS
jgi:hypothetical protein